jgi:hypothetical protein
VNTAPSIVYTKTEEFSPSFEMGVVLGLFKQSFWGDLFHLELPGATDGSLVAITKEIVEHITSVLGERPRVTCFDDGVILLRVPDRFLLTIVGGGTGDMWEAGYRSFELKGFGGEEDVVAVRTVLKSIIRRADIRAPTIRWHYSASGMRNTAAIPLDKPKPVFDTFYPWIEGGLTAYFDRFAASDAVVLVLLGDAGVGKTSFIRQLLWHLRWNCAFTYDSELLGKDDLFVNFITNIEDHVMVVEDADVFLTSRERDHNDMMARFLNVSDGLYKTNRTKKLIFTGNLTQLNQIDQALLREGRCFDCLMFRPLRFEEAVRAAQSAGLAPPTDRRDHTLAQLFATKQHQKTLRVGF